MNIYRFIELIESALAVTKYPYVIFLMMDLKKINGRFLCNSSKDTRIEPILASALKYHARCY